MRLADVSDVQVVTIESQAGRNAKRWPV